MQVDTQAVTINVAPKKLFEFLSNPENLAKWAKGLCKGVYREGNGWAIETDIGRVGLKCLSNAELGVIDYHISPPLPLKIVAYSRVVPNKKGSVFVFTHFQLPLVPEKVFEQQKKRVGEGLAALKVLMESG